MEVRALSLHIYFKTNHLKPNSIAIATLQCATLVGDVYLFACVCLSRLLTVQGISDFVDWPLSNSNFVNGEMGIFYLKLHKKNNNKIKLYLTQEIGFG